MIWIIRLRLIMRVSRGKVRIGILVRNKMGIVYEIHRKKEVRLNKGHKISKINWNKQRKYLMNYQRSWTKLYQSSFLKKIKPTRNQKNKKRLMNLGQFETELFCDENLTKLSKCIERRVGNNGYKRRGS